MLLSSSGFEVPVSNEENSVIQKLEGFVAEDTLSDREGQLCDRLVKRGILESEYINGTQHYKLWMEVDEDGYF